MIEECCICFSTEGEDSNDILIKPCVCNSVKHRSCLNTWRSTRINTTSFTNCEVCKFKFIIENLPESQKEILERYTKLSLIIFIDLVKVFITFLIISFIVGWFSNWLDIFGIRYIRIYESIPKIIETGIITTMCYASVFYITYLFFILNLGFPRIEISKPSGKEVAIYILLLLIIAIGLSMYYIFNYIILYRCKQRVLYSKSKTQIIKDLK